jgi:hypothetical protein
MTILDFPDRTAVDPARTRESTSPASRNARATAARVALVQLHNQLWRVTRPSGEVLGYIELFTQNGSDRYRAKRMMTVQRNFIAVGEFWTMHEAIDCFG